ncbi:hypothetical protein A3A76_01280 [Candidatus Woesebacteria bacterium RIFCSPLOWO2_01_FULL_39_23]|uniref:Uncharacterized protein n=1 Tax=Candidatus Woesebacteria bacterium RIFCSPHIGHO2_01_FULL_40_22 TaxID=1802499 RepID=A0A1F7YHV5_9BACT|nr:MAG: hypothetical protein A2141_05090 [Candidatus Woesebacteria bacterium RBG_16_40_11]OGM26459.1 MAG: hypothetical protein A2628_02875 [Candidatus Woesebacteria bacterium RIFCSPHIGHO2_01_FULL_40_22]OGM37628.1 MAG: hypothetical protein A3E41_05390 [Candidatus Woesebacteria bacterium RIFCSPHIGHO2_12_FULL_38_9]OGM62912.1 MAG: hypothetical protein A3A76_01280 [Candidatus Woesebacteria bacterium RIFCSPLOWO2_01_FULL_39_23]
MQLSKEAIDEFVVIWKKEYGKSISETLATVYANKLINLFTAIYRPITNVNKINLEEDKG